RHGGRRDAAARALGINRTTLYKKMKRLGITDDCELLAAQAGS
ncbi:MAG: helix-turn-helix domain-containing protein, partial [Planctomycetaceae bacterium]